MKPPPSALTSPAHSAADVPLLRGRCTLVGAGPGDPELLTLKAVRAIQAASVLLVDDLVSPGVLALARPMARVVHVGKRGGCKSTPQGFIERLMQMAVLEGENVVRLKGGDPMVFGRGGEEVEHLRAAGIAVEVVNGVTAGIACSAALGTALTHREQAHGVLFITGHAHPGRETDWALIAGTAHAARLTLVIYMGVSRLADIEEGLLAGLPAHTPAAIVERVSLPEQRVARCTLASLHATARSEGLASPCIIVVGDVLQGVAAAAGQQAPALHSPFAAQG